MQMTKTARPGARFLSVSVLGDVRANLLENVTRI